ncbi:MAG: hypothetical protein AAFR57_17530 [Pseudomonadota bacterium]
MTDERQTTDDGGDVNDIMASIRERVFAAAEEQDRGDTSEPLVLTEDLQVFDAVDPDQGHNVVDIAPVVGRLPFVRHCLFPLF